MIGAFFTWAGSAIVDWWLQLSVVVMAIIGLAVFAYFFRSWKAGLAAVALGAAVYFVGMIDRKAYQRRAAEELAAMRVIADARLVTITDLQAADTAQRQTDNATIAELRDLIDNAPVDDSPCGDEDFARRVGETR